MSVLRFLLLVGVLLLVLVNSLMASSARRDWILLVLGAAVFTLGVAEMFRLRRGRKAP